MSLYRGPEPKPGILSLITLISFVWSGLTVLRIIAWAVVTLVLGTASWLLGPVVGAAGSLISIAIVALMIAQSFLSVLLFAAAWKTWKGDPAGRSLHKAWAWINILLDGLALLFSGGVAPDAWLGLGYAVGLIYVMDQPEIRAYFDRGFLPPSPR